MRKLASIQIINKLEPIPKYDKVELATVLGWQVLVKKDEFKVNDKCIYIEVDSLVPSDDIRFDFLSKRHYRIKTLKMCGVISQGIVFPLNLFDIEDSIEVDTDVTERLKIVKYDPELSEEKAMLELERVKAKANPIHKFLLRFSWYRKFFVKKKESWPKFIQKTDEDRIQSRPSILKILEESNIYITEKLDGQSATFFLNKNSFGVCSRNIWLKTPCNNNYWLIAKKYDIEKNLKKLKMNYIIQGEIVGPGIQGNKYKLTELDFFVFNIIDINCEGWLDIEHMCYVAKSLGLKTVPILYKGPLQFKTVEDAVTYSKGNSILYETLREGIVVREDTMSISRKPNSFKVISPDFLLKHE